MTLTRKIHYFKTPPVDKYYTGEPLVNLDAWISRISLPSYDWLTDSIPTECTHLVDISQIEHDYGGKRQASEELEYRLQCGGERNASGEPVDLYNNSLNKLSLIVNDKHNKIVFYTSNFQKNPQDFVDFLRNWIEDPASCYFIFGFLSDLHRFRHTMNIHINTGVLTGWLKEPILRSPEPYPILTKPSKRFSIFSRRIDENRQQLFYYLVSKNIINNCHYSFGTSHPDYYNDVEWTKTVQELKDAVPQFDKGNAFFLEDTNYKIHKWLEGAPYTLGEYTDIHDSILTEKTADSYIHIVIETLYNDDPGTEIKVTEKLGRAIALKKPFILFAPPYTLDHLHYCGFKTFHPLIDERYDTELNPLKRRIMLQSIINKFNTMPENEFLETMKEFEEITNHNYELLKSISGEFNYPGFENLGIFS